MTEKETRQMCDRVLTRAVEQMFERGAPVPQIIDRLLTYAAAQACHIDSSANTAAAFRVFAERIEGGMFAHLESGQTARKH